MTDDSLYLRIGGALGVIPALATFIGGWWYCAATYGFLLGFGLGWLPSAILAAIVFFAIMILWGLIAACVGFLLIPKVVELLESEEFWQGALALAGLAGLTYLIARGLDYLRVRWGSRENEADASSAHVFRENRFGRKGRIENTEF